MCGVIGNKCIGFKKSSNLWVWSTLEVAGGRTVQNRKFIMEICYLKYHFWQLLSLSKHYDQIWNIFCQICRIFEFFESRKFCRLLGGERCILKRWSWRSMLFKMTFLTTFISIIMLYDKIFIFGHPWAYLGTPGRTWAQKRAIITSYPKFGRWHQSDMCSTYLWGCKTI